MTHTQTATYTNPLIKRMFFAALAIAALVFASYLYFVGSTTVAVINQKAYAQEIKEVESDISKLEEQYIAKLDGLTKQYAYEQGFVALGESDFATRKAFATIQQ
jgi:hypothetical protein